MRAGNSCMHITKPTFGGKPHAISRWFATVFPARKLWLDDTIGSPQCCYSTALCTGIVLLLA